MVFDVETKGQLAILDEEVGLDLDSSGAFLTGLGSVEYLRKLSFGEVKRRCGGIVSGGSSEQVNIIPSTSCILLLSLIISKPKIILSLWLSEHVSLLSRRSRPKIKTRQPIRCTLLLSRRRCCRSHTQQVVQLHHISHWLGLRLSNRRYFLALFLGLRLLLLF